MFSRFNRHYFDLLWAMTEKELKVRYKKAFFGFLWILVQPLSQLIVIGLVVHFVVNISIRSYFPFLLAGLLPWSFFTMSLSRSTQVFVEERRLIQKATFPLEILIFSIILANLFHFFISMMIFLGILALGKMLIWEMVWIIPLGIVWVTIFTIGFSLLTATLQVKYRDVGYLVSLGLPLWFYITPLLYRMDMLSEKVRDWFYFNPMTGIILLFQQLVTTDLIINELFWISFLLGLLIVGLGIVAFRKEREYVVDYV